MRAIGTRHLLPPVLISLAFVAPAPLPATAGPSAAEFADAPSLCLAFLGHGSLPTGLRFEDTEVGGLSALVFDAEAGVFFALSDDRGEEPERGPARLYTLTVELAEPQVPSETSSPETDSAQTDRPETDPEEREKKEPSKVEMRVTGVTVLRDRNGEPFEPGTVDPEGLVLTPAGTFLVSSEGDASRDVDPFIRELSRDGRTVRSFSLPPAYLPGAGRGVRPNLGFEALTRTSDFSSVFAGTENALVQDGPKADLEQGSPARLLRFDPSTGRPTAEYLYLTEPVITPPFPPGARSGAGLVELLALDATYLLAMERSYGRATGLAVRLFLVSLADATEITGRAALSRPLSEGTGADSPEAEADEEPPPAQPVAKRLLLDLAEPGIPLDNLEALAWGPDLADGRKTLLVLSDNNFNRLQTTQLLVFAVERTEEPSPCP